MRSFFLITIFMLLACGSLDDIDLGSSREGRPDQESWNSTIIMTKAGAKQAIVQAGHMEKYDDQQYIFLTDSVAVDFFDPDEVHTSLLLSDEARIDERTDFMTALGNVIVISDSGITMFTDTLDWNAELELIYTNDEVMITTEHNDTLYGTGFESDAALESWKILQPHGVTEREAKK